MKLDHHVSELSERNSFPLVTIDACFSSDCSVHGLTLAQVTSIMPTSVGFSSMLYLVVHMLY